MLKPATFGVDREGTLEEQQFLQETFGDILPVARVPALMGNNFLTQKLIRLMGMETFFTAMYDCPDTLHALMGAAAR